MRKTFILMLLCFNINAYSTDYYVDVNGNDNGSGSLESPWKTWQKAFDVAVAGDIVNIRGGVYYFDDTFHGDSYAGVHVINKSGSSNKKIIIQAYLNEVPILDGSKMAGKGHRYGIYFSNCAYYQIEGLIVRNCTEYSGKLATAWLMANCTFMSINRCSVYGCGNGFSTSGFCNFIDFINCDAHDNMDWSDNGGFANGFSLTMYKSPGVYAQGTHVTLTGCRSWSNSDDGFDSYGANGYITYHNCWSFWNGWGGGGNGNGDGFKSEPHGTIESGIQRTTTKCLAFENKGAGFNSHVYVIERVYNNTSYKNGNQGFAYAYGNHVSCILRNNISYANAKSNFDNNHNPIIRYVNDHNSWNRRVSVTNDDFVSLTSKGADGKRQSDGSLPDLDFLKLKISSDLIDSGIDVGLPFLGKAPDIGAFESKQGNMFSLQKPKAQWLKKLILLF